MPQSAAHSLAQVRDTRAVVSPETLPQAHTVVPCRITMPEELMVPRELTIHSSYVANPNGTKPSAAGTSQHRLRQLLTVIADGWPSQPRDHIKRNLPAAQPEFPGRIDLVKPLLRRHPRESRPGYIADANVISELMRAEPHPAVAGWVAAQPSAVL
jgi:hypothetical protein